MVMGEPMRCSELYTGQIIESEGIKYFLVLVLPKTKARETVSGEYVGTVRCFRVDTGEYQNFYTLTDAVESKEQMTDDEKTAFLMKLQLSEKIKKDVNTYINAKFEDIKNVYHLKEGEKILLGEDMLTNLYRVIEMEKGKLVESAVATHDGKLYCISRTVIDYDNLFVGKKIDDVIYETTRKDVVDVDEKVKQCKEQLKAFKERVEKETDLTNEKLGKYCIRKVEGKKLKSDIKKLYYNSLNRVKENYYNDKGQVVYVKSHNTDQNVENALGEIKCCIDNLFGKTDKSVPEQIKEDYPNVKIHVCERSTDIRKQIRSVLPRIK